MPAPVTARQVILRHRWGRDSLADTRSGEPCGTILSHFSDQGRATLSSFRPLSRLSGGRGDSSEGRGTRGILAVTLPLDATAGVARGSDAPFASLSSADSTRKAALRQSRSVTRRDQLQQHTRGNIMRTVRLSLTVLLTAGLLFCFAGRSTAADEAKFQVGFAKRDITPQKPMPMWGYGDRHAALSDGIMDPLMAKAVVIVAGDQKLALVGTDIGRGPTIAMMEKIRRELKEKSGIEHVLICGSHSHHGPVIELTDNPGMGKGKFDDAVAYAQKYPDVLIEMIVEAANNTKPARLGVAKKNVSLNRNRHSKRTPKPTEPMLAVLRFDDEAGKPLVVMVNFAAHPTMIDSKILKYSADYPGHMQRKVEEKLGANCVFMQGAAGDMSAIRRLAPAVRSNSATRWPTKS